MSDVVERARPARRRNRGKKPGAPVTKQILRAALELQSEHKVYPVFGGGAVTTSGAITLLSGISSGSTFQTRIGNKARVEALKLRWAAVVGDVYNFLRFIIFRWNPDSAVDSPTQSTLLDSNGASVVDPTHYPLNWLLRKKFKVLHDETMSLETMAYYTTSVQYGPGSGKWTRTGVVDMPLRNLITFDTNTTGNGVGHIYLMVVSDSTLTPNPSFNWAGQLLFSDV